MFNPIARILKPLMRLGVAFGCLALLVLDVFIVGTQYSRRCCCADTYYVLKDETVVALWNAGDDFADDAIAYELTIACPRWRPEGAWATTQLRYHPFLLPLDYGSRSSDFSNRPEVLQHIAGLVSKNCDDDDFRRWVDSGQQPLYRACLSGYFHNTVAITLASLCVPAFVVGVRNLGRNRIRRRRMARGMCPECDYELRGNLDAGCPECGWRRTTHTTE